MAMKTATTRPTLMCMLMRAMTPGWDQQWHFNAQKCWLMPEQVMCNQCSAMWPTSAPNHALVYHWELDQMEMTDNQSAISIDLNKCHWRVARDSHYWTEWQSWGVCLGGCASANKDNCYCIYNVLTTRARLPFRIHPTWWMTTIETASERASEWVVKGETTANYLMCTVIMSLWEKWC